MVGRTKQPTKAQQRRFHDLQEIGCIACWIEGYPLTPGDIHHLVEGGRRQGHDATICLCPWHHRGQPDGNLAPSRMEIIKGPSLARSKRDFVARYGAERELLEKTEQLLEKRRAA